MKEVCVLAFLGWNTWTDLKTRQISLTAVGIFGAVGLIMLVCNDGISWQNFVPIGVGGFFLAVSVLTQGELGMGDGWLLLALGIVLDMEEFMTVLFFALLGCALCAAVMLVIFRKGKKTEIPFVPFLLFGYMGGLLLW